MKKIFIKIFLLFIIVQIGYFAYSFFSKDNKKSNLEAAEDRSLAEPKDDFIPPEKKDRVEEIEIEEGSTFGNLMEEAGISTSDYLDIYNSSKDIYDMVKIRLGRVIELIYDKDSDELKELRYKIDTEDELHVRNTAYFEFPNSSATSTEDDLGQDNWAAEVTPIPYTVKVVKKEGEVDTSVYMAALDAGIDERAIIDLANVFQWSIDFAMDPRVGDSFRFVYEERYLDGEFIMPGRILAAEYINEGKEYFAYYFEESEENIGYFDENGNSVQKMFLKSPVAFKYISSGYTTGNRVIMEIGLSGSHRAIDYAAPMGTPIRAVGNGRVTFAGWNSGGYGYLTKIRHNATYSTNYAHQSKLGVSVGQKVEQGDIIGYVGSTGYSTGPHLHYEMVKYGAKIDPLKEILPPGKPIKDENKDRFWEVKEKYNKLLNQ